MYRNLSATSLGLSIRQSELLELALTYGFKGVDVDMFELVRRAKSQGGSHATRFLSSAKVTIGGFELPVNWTGSDEAFAAELVKTAELADVAASLGAKVCNTNILPANDEHPFHANFELHRKRLTQLGDLFAARDIRLAVGFQACPALRTDKRFEFIYDAQKFLMLLKVVSHSHVGLLYDTWNWHVGNGQTSLLTSLRGDQIFSVRIGDLPTDADLSQVTEEQRLLPGTGGAIDSAAVLNTLVELKFHGPVTVFPHPATMAKHKRDAAVQASQQCLKAEWSAIVEGSKLATA